MRRVIHLPRTELSEAWQRQIEENSRAFEAFAPTSDIASPCSTKQMEDSQTEENPILEPNKLAPTTLEMLNKELTAQLQESSVLLTRGFECEPIKDRKQPSRTSIVKEAHTRDYVVGPVWASRDSQCFWLDQIHDPMSLSDTMRALESFSIKRSSAHAKLTEAKAKDPGS